MTPSGIITLTTDFGLEDPFVGILHGVILGRCPAARVVDLTHGVAPQAIAEAAFWLERSFRWFPAGSVHVAVVDPGVGTDRAALVVQAQGHVFVAPDNGLLGAIAREPGAITHAIDVARLGLPVPSRTFHGRDVFAPVAAELAAGRLDPGDVGPPARALSRSRRRGWRTAQREHRPVISIDHFGNLMTDISAAELRRFERPAIEVGSREVPVAALSRCSPWASRSPWSARSTRSKLPARTGMRPISSVPSPECRSC